MTQETRDVKLQQEDYFSIQPDSVGYASVAATPSVALLKKDQASSLVTPMIQDTGLMTPNLSEYGRASNVIMSSPIPQNRNRVVSGNIVSAVTTLTCVEDLIKSRPSFPATAPKVFRIENQHVVTNRQLESVAALQPILKAVQEQHIFLVSPKLYIRLIGYRHVAVSEAGPDTIMSSNVQSKHSPDAKALTRQPRQRVMDIKVELTKYIDTDFLIYNPEAMLQFNNDNKHSHKQLSIYKYIASSKLKNVCNVIRERFATEFDHFEVRILNDEFVDTFPKSYSGVFFAEGCSKYLTAGLCVAFPPLIPFVAYEYANRCSYEVGLVFRIRKQSIEEILIQLMKIAADSIQPMDINVRKRWHLHTSDDLLQRPPKISVNEELSEQDQVSTV